MKLSGAFDNPRTQQAGEVMERQVHHLNRLVDDLLEVSRITRGVIEVRKEPLDLTRIVKAAIETSRPVLDNLRHELTVDLDPEPMCVGGDPVRLTQVFANLLNNAAKYTNHGGRISISHAPRERRGGHQRQGQRHRHRARTRWRRSSTCSCRSIARRGDRRAGWASA